MTQELLKADHFGSITRVTDARGVRIRRETTTAAFGLRWFARWVAGHEARSLTVLADVPGIPRLLHWDGVTLERSYIAGQPMHDAQPRDPKYFHAARRLLLAMHARGVAHNDLAKEPNWLVTDEGLPALVDFQMGWVSRARRKGGHGALFRLLAREDLRHLLKHKRHYLPDTLTPIERRVLAQRSWIARAWKASGKRVYNFVTRKILNYADNEGRGAKT